MEFVQVWQLQRTDPWTAPKNRIELAKPVPGWPDYGTLQTGGTGVKLAGQHSSRIVQNRTQTEKTVARMMLDRC